VKSRMLVLSVIVFSAASVSKVSLAQTNLPKYDLRNMQYEGAFRLPSGTFGDARVAWSEGKIAVDEENGTFFFSGSNKKSIAEFNLPEAINISKDLSELVMVDQPIQQFNNILDDAETGNPNGVSNITGLGIVGGNLVVNAAVYYDANASNDHTTLLVENDKALNAATIKGYFKLEGRNRAAGWISPVPPVYQDVFGGDLIFGHASNLPINSRSSMGPSAFLVKENDLLSANSGDYIDSKELLGFSINKPLHPDFENETMQNDLWTELSQTAYGFIVPGTSTYLTIGQTGGVHSGIGYKITQESGYQCGGFCSYDFKDYSNYVWLWDINDLIEVSKGLMDPANIRPYYWGKIDVPFQQSDDGSYAEHRIIGGSSTQTGKLYLVIDSADSLQSQYEDQPVVLVYDLNIDSLPMPPANFSIEN